MSLENIRTTTDIISSALPTNLYEEYQALLTRVTTNESSAQECLEFLCKLEEHHVASVVIHYLGIEIREHFINLADAMEYVQGRLQLGLEKGWDAEWLADMHALLADVYRKSARILDSEEQYKEALNLLPGDEKSPVKAVIYARFAHIEYQKGGSEKSEEYVALAKSIVREYIDEERYLQEKEIVGRLQILVAIATLADLRRMQKQFEDVEGYWKLSLPVAEKCGEIELCRSYSWLVHASYMLDKQDDMLKYAIENKDIICELKNNPKKFRGTAIRRVVRHLDRICYTLYDSGHQKRSISYHLESLALALQYFGENHPVYGLQLASIALSYLKIDDESNYAEYKKKAEALLERISLSLEDEGFLSTYIDEISPMYYDLGIACKQNKDYVGAESYFTRGLQLVSKAHNDAPMRTVKWHKSLGFIYRMQGKGADALEHLKICLKLHQEQEVQNTQEISFLQSVIDQIRSGKVLPASVGRQNQGRMSSNPRFMSGRGHCYQSPRTKH